MFDLIHEIGQTLRNNRLRTFLTGFAVAWGIFILIILLGAARGVVNSFESHVGSRNNNVLEVYGGRTNIPYKGYKDGRYISLRNSDIDAITTANPEIVEDVVSTAWMSGTLSTDRDYTSDGFDAIYPIAIDDEYKVLYGRKLNQPDMNDARRVVMICERSARQLFGSAESAVGGTVRSLGLAWTVVGVYSHRWQTSALIPYTTYKAITGNDDSVYKLQVYVKGLTTEQQGEEAEEAVRLSLGKVHDISPDDRNALWMWNRFTSYISTAKGLNNLEVAVWIIGFLTLLSGIVGVSNIMFVSVRERTHEIGIRRAIGAKPRSILVQILLEAVAVTAIFGYAGVFTGMVVLEIVSRILGDNDAFLNPTVDLSLAIKVTIAMIVAGCAAGLFPALKAIKVRPVEALRDE